MHSQYRAVGLQIIAFATLATLAGLLASDASPQAFPSKHITLLWPATPGTAGQTFFQAIGEEASKMLGRPIIVEPKPGAGGKVAFNALRAGDRDGHLLGAFNAGPLVIQPLASSDPSAKVLPGRDYIPINLVLEFNQALYANTSLPFKDLRALIAYAKANPGKLNYGSSGIGGVSHLAMELFRSAANIDLVHIPYKGASLAMAGLLNGEVQLFITSPELKPYVTAGRLVVLGTTGSDQWNVFPDQRPIHQTVPGYIFTAWFGIVAPPGVPAEVVSKLNTAFNLAMGNAERNAAIKNSIAIMGADLTAARSPEDFARFINDDLKRMEPVVRRAGIKAE